VCSYSLDQKEHVVSSLWSFQGARELEPALRRDAGRPAASDRGSVSQNSTACGLQYVEVDVRSRRIQSPDESSRGHIDGLDAYRSKSSGIPRKEVIQPQLPLRLPCYDFTPIIDPTFGGCLPCGLAHRLRVLPTFVV
jgi:hypothetical protein